MSIGAISAVIIFALVGVVVIFGALWHDFREWRRGRAHAYRF